jgi:hypothetical protein
LHFLRRFHLETESDTRVQDTTEEVIIVIRVTIVIKKEVGQTQDNEIQAATTDAANQRGMA